MGIPLAAERPKSPWTTPTIQCRYCSTTDWLRCNCSRSAASESGVALRPRIGVGGIARKDGRAREDQDRDREQRDDREQRSTAQEPQNGMGASEPDGGWGGLEGVRPRYFGRTRSSDAAHASQKSWKLKLLNTLLGFATAPRTFFASPSSRG